MIRVMTVYTASTVRSKKSERLLDEKNKSQVARIFRTVARSPKPLSAVKVIESVGRPKIPSFNVRWHLSRLRREGLLLAIASSSSPAAIVKPAPTNDLTFSVSMNDVAREVAARAGRWVTLTAPRADVYSRIEKAVGAEQAKQAMIAIGFFDITEPVQGNALLGKIGEGIRAGIGRIGFRP